MKTSVDRFVLAVIAAVLLVGFFLPATEGCRPARPVTAPVDVIVASEDGGVYAEPFDGPSGSYLAPQCARACANLQKRSCSDGFTRHGEDSCYVICQRAEGTGKIDLKTACVANASTLVLIRACGTYRCL